MADYSDIGFDQFLQRSNPPQTFGATNLQQNPQASDYLMQSLSANKITGGILSSNDGKFVVDLNSGILQISNGASNLVTLGTLPDGSIGLQIKDNNGNILLQISSGRNVISSPDGVLVLDFDQSQLTLNDNGVPIGLIGKQVGGF